jgi:anaerobic selenocysteine-containing dehydrogenase
VFVVDPRRTETAKAAGEHVFIRPGTDVFFYLAFLHELLRSGGVDRARVGAHTTGLRSRWPRWCGVDAREVRRGHGHGPREIAARDGRDYREADGAALYCSTGVNMGSNGSLAFWLQEVHQRGQRATSIGAAERSSGRA